MTPREQQVMTLFEGGAGLLAIARELSLAPNYVAAIVNSYDFTRLEGAQRRYETRLCAANDAHVRAVLATGRRYA